MMIPLFLIITVYLTASTMVLVCFRRVAMREKQWRLKWLIDMQMGISIAAWVFLVAAQYFLEETNPSLSIFWTMVSWIVSILLLVSFILAFVIFIKIKALLDLAIKTASQLPDNLQSPP